jgi:hypothetical protein
MQDLNEIEEFLEYYKDRDNMPCPEHEPIRFAAWVRDFRYYKAMIKREDNKR